MNNGVHVGNKTYRYANLPRLEVLILTVLSKTESFVSNPNPVALVYSELESLWELLCSYT